MGSEKVSAGTLSKTSKLMTSMSMNFSPSLPDEIFVAFLIPSKIFVDAEGRLLGEIFAPSKAGDFGHQLDG